MKKKKITKFPKDFFELKRPTINASEAVKNDTSLEWEEKTKSSKIIKLVQKND